MSKHQPPKLARTIFEWYCGSSKVEDLLGDMDEWFYKTLESHSPFRAKLKYWKQVLSLIFSYAIQKRKKQAQLSPFSHNAFSLAIIKNYFIVASRSLYRHKYFTIVNAVGLAIGMSVSLLLITLVGFVYTYDNFHENGDHIYRVISSHEKNGNSYDLASAPIAIADRLKNEFTGIESVTRIVPNFRHEVMINENNIPIQGFYVDPEFLSIFSYPLITGDKITALQKSNSIVLTQSTAKKIFGDENAFGKIIEVAKLGSFEVTGILKDLQIIGVLKDFNYATLRWEIKSFAFRMDLSQFKHANLKVSFKDAYECINEMEVLWKKLGNTKKFEAEFLDDEINRAFHNYTTLLKLAGVLGLLAISISLLGMLGMVVYTSESRTKEVGIRKVLGASVTGITFLLSKDYIKMMGWAFIIAIPLSVFVIDKMLSSMQHYRVRLTVWDIIAGMLILMAMGLATLSSQTIKTASTNPAETLKSE
jgi:hypothetical protein